MAAYRAKTTDELKLALEKAFDLDAPVLIEVPVDRTTEVSPWEFLMAPAMKIG